MAYVQTRNQIISRAYRICGALPKGQTISNEQIANGADALNAIMEELYNEDVKFWKLNEYQKTFTAASEVTGSDASIYTCILSHTATAETTPVTGANYTTYWEKKGETGGTHTVGDAYVSIGDFLLSDLNDEAIDIIYAFYRSDYDDNPVYPIDMQQWSNITDENETGDPIYIWIDRDKTPGAGRVHLWPQPDNTTDVLHCFTMTKGSSLDTASAIPDFPKHWINYLTHRLAADVGKEEQIDIAQIGYLLNRATAMKRAARRGDGNKSATYFAEAMY